MAIDRDHSNLAQIAAQASWVRRLAVALARDVHAGEDIAQEALLAAARGGPRTAALREWLAGVVRNLARLRRRSESRRAERERDSARLERVDDPAIAFERLELQEALLGAVRELAEPYRTAVLLRWFENLAPEEIARRTGAPVRTVHTRLHRALALLREALERRSRGDRSRWLAAWLPLLPKSSTGWKWVLLMDLKLKLAAAALVAAAALTIWVASSPRGAVAPSAAAALANAPVESPRALPEPIGSTEPQEPARVLVPVAETAPAMPPAAPRTLHGWVIDAGGAKLPGIPVTFLGEPAARATSDALGAFEIEVAADGELDVDAPGWISVYETRVELPDPLEGYYLVLARPRTIGGFVRESDGRPSGGAGVTLGPVERTRFDYFSRYSDSLRTALGLALEASTMRRWSTSSAADGSFQLEAARIPGMPVRAAQHGGRAGETTVPEDDQPVTIVLGPEHGAQRPALHGRTLDPQGTPVAGVQLLLGRSSSRSEDHGDFSIDVDASSPNARLIAIHPDWAPVIQPCLSASPTDAGAWPSPLVLTFRDPVPGIAGVVRSPEGKPVKDVEVLALDPPSWNEYLGRIGEGAIRGGEGSDVYVGGETIRTGEDGHFRIRGLAGRSYRLVARDKRTLEIEITEPIAGGTRDAVITLGRPGGLCRIAGVVVDLEGQPIAGARLAAVRNLQDGRRCDTDWVSADDQGRFEIPRMSTEIEGFLVWPEMGPAEFVRLDPAAQRDALRFEVGRIARILVQIQTQDLAPDTLVFLDAAGKPLTCGTKVGRGGWRGGGESIDMRGGKSEVIIISERARTLVLKQKGSELLRVPLQLDPTRVNLVRP